MAETNAPIVVEAVGLQKIFYDFWKRPKANAVNGINFTVRQGEVFGFLGPNGSGKSTTVKMMLGLLRPTSGSLRVMGNPPRDVQTKLQVGYLPEETYLYKYLTAAETLDFFGSLFQLSGEQKKRRIDELLKMVGMKSAANRPVGEFSKGMARRIGLAQALINDPNLIILDEPTSGLDPIGCREIKDIIKTLARRGKTVILCSHLLADVQDVCDNVMIMYGGKIRAQGELDELLSVEEKTRITVPRLKPEVLQKIIDILKDVLGDEQPTVDNPTMNLEEFFMDVVNKARKESISTAGVDDSGAIASFLEGEGESKRATEAILAQLNQKDEPEDEPEKEPVKPDLDKLSALRKEEEVQKPSETEKGSSSGPSDEERAEKSKLLNDLLNRDKD